MVDDNDSKIDELCTNIQKNLQSFSAGALHASAVIIIHRNLDAEEAEVVSIRQIESNDGNITSIKSILQGNAIYSLDQPLKSLYSETLRLDPSDVMTRLRYSDLLTAKGEHDEALTQLKIALSYDQNNIKIQLHLANKLRRTGDPSESIVAYKHALNMLYEHDEILSTDNELVAALIYRDLSAVYVEIGDLQNATEQLERGIERANFNKRQDLVRRLTIALEQLPHI